MFINFVQLQAIAYCFFSAYSALLQFLFYKSQKYILLIHSHDEKNFIHIMKNSHNVF